MPLLSAKATVWDKTQEREGEKAGDGGEGKRESFPEHLPRASHHTSAVSSWPAGTTRTLPRPLPVATLSSPLLSVPPVAAILSPSVQLLWASQTIKWFLPRSLDLHSAQQALSRPYLLAVCANSVGHCLPSPLLPWLVCTELGLLLLPYPSGHSSISSQVPLPLPTL